MLRFRNPPPSLYYCFAALFGLPGCAVDRPEDPTRARTESATRPIYFGSPDLNPDHMAVVALSHGPGLGSFCTGTLITQTVVMTAAHCMEGETAASTWIYVGNDIVAFDGEFFAVTEVEMHWGYDTITDENDLALLRLERSIPSDVAPIPYLPPGLGLTAADEGSTVEFSGFGVTEFGSDDVKLTVNLTIDQVCLGPASCLFFLQDVNADSFAYDMTAGGPCAGDSGGPAFVFRNGNEYLAGVTAYGDEDCLLYGVSNMVDTYSGWIEAFLARQGSEDCTIIGDEDFDTFSDCDDSDCTFDPLCAGPDHCDTAPTIDCGEIVDTTTEGAGAFLDIYGDCTPDWTEDGPELAWIINAPPGTQVTARLTYPGGATATDVDIFALEGAGGTCDTDVCLASSVEEAGLDEELTFVVPGLGAYLVVDTYDEPGAFLLEVECQGGGGETCDNGVDDDGDGDVDCQDVDCLMLPECAPGFTPDGGPGNGNDNKGGCQQTEGGGAAFLGLVLLLGLIRRRRLARVSSP